MMMMKVVIIEIMNIMIIMIDKIIIKSEKSTALTFEHLVAFLWFFFMHLFLLIPCALATAGGSGTVLCG